VQVKRALAWFAGLAGIAALGRLLAGRSKARSAPAAPATPTDTTPTDSVVGPEGDPAEELRRRLAESRTAASTPEAASGKDEPVDDRRARLHAQARETIDAMADDSGQP